MRYSGQCARRAAARTPFRGARRPGAAGDSRDSRRAVTMALGCPRGSGGFAAPRSRAPVVASARRFPSNAVALVLRAARGLSTAACSPGAARVRPVDLPRPGPPAARDRGAGGVAPRDPHRARGAHLGPEGGDPRRRGRGAPQLDTASRSMPAFSEPSGCPAPEIEALAAGRFGSLRRPAAAALLDFAVRLAVAPFSTGSRRRRAPARHSAVPDEEILEAVQTAALAGLPLRARDGPRRRGRRRARARHPRRRGTRRGSRDRSRHAAHAGRLPARRSRWPRTPSPRSPSSRAASASSRRSFAPRR